MRKLNLLILIAASLFIYSCQKDISDTLPTPTEDNLVKTYAEDLFDGTDHYADSFSVSYDSDKRLTSLQSIKNGSNKILYTYPQANLYKMDIFKAGVLSIHEDFYLNSYSLIDSSFQYNSDGDSSTEKYVYNANRQLINLYEYSYTISNGAELDNITNYEYNSDGSILKTKDNFSETSFEYYPSITSNVASLLQPYYPLSNKLVKKSVTTGSGLASVLNYTYTFDNKNRLIKEVVTFEGTPATLVKSYTY